MPVTSDYYEDDDESAEADGGETVEEEIEAEDEPDEEPEDEAEEEPDDAPDEHEPAPRRTGGSMNSPNAWLQEGTKRGMAVAGGGAVGVLAAFWLGQDPKTMQVADVPGGPTFGEVSAMGLGALAFLASMDVKVKKRGWNLHHFIQFGSIALGSFGVMAMLRRRDIERGIIAEHQRALGYKKVSADGYDYSGQVTNY